MLSVFKFLNFGESIINWMKAFYNNIKSAVIQGLNFFNIARCSRQSDLLSLYLVILCAEIFALKIRGNKEMCGIEATLVEHKLSYFADDTSLILHGSKKSLYESLSKMDWFANISGLNINFAKTQVSMIGSKKNSKEIVCPDENLWGETNLKLLSINFAVKKSTK